MNLVPIHTHDKLKNEDFQIIEVKLKIIGLFFSKSLVIFDIEF